MIQSPWRAFCAPTAVAFALALTACSSDETPPPKTSSGDPEPADPKPTGAVNMEVYKTETQVCPPGNVHIDVGAVSSNPPKTFADGEDGAEVTCAVTPDGSKLNASGTITRGAFSFGFRDVVTAGGSAIGHVDFADPASGVRYGSPDDKPCVFQFAPGSGQEIKPGRIFVQFDCSSLVSEADAKNDCSSRYGYVLLENCDSTATAP